MCRVLVYLGKQEVSLYDLLYASDNSLIHQSYDPQLMSSKVIQNLAGFGVAAWSKSSQKPDIPYFYKTANLPFFDNNLLALSKKISANCVLAHVRGVTYSTKEIIISENAHPFRYKNYSLALAHNGTISDIGLMKPLLIPHIKKEVLQQIAGTTDSELLYALYMSQFEDPTTQIGIDEAVEALTSALFILKDIRNTLGLHRSSPINLFISNGEYAIVTRFAFDFGQGFKKVEQAFFEYHSLWFTYGEKYGEYDGTYKMHGSQSRANILFASEPLTTDRTAWIELPEYSISKIWMKDNEFMIRTLDLNI